MGRPLRPNGVRLGTYLTVLVLTPVLGLAIFGVREIRRQVQISATASQVETAVRDASNFAAARARVLDELTPAMMRTAVHVPELRARLGAQRIAGIEATGIPQLVTTRLRPATDAAFHTLDASASTRASGRRFAAQLARYRSELDSAAGVNPGYKGFLTLIDAMATAESTAVQSALSLGLGRRATVAVTDLELVSTAAQFETQATQAINATQFPRLGVSVASAEQRWSAARAASDAALARASHSVAAEWRRAVASDTAREVDQLMTRELSGQRLSLVESQTLYRLTLMKRTAMLDVVALAVDRAAAAAVHQRSVAQGNTRLDLLLIALLVLLSIGATIAVGRAISRPLVDLAGRARSVSEGELVAVVPTGPREVRTVAAGLSAAVDSLRKVAAQAAAVQEGDLAGDVVREPLPGPLGAVMHESVSAMVEAIHARDAARAELAHQAAHDALTGLPNRGQVMRSLERLLHQARRTGAITGVMFVDLDNFKTVNDTLGHAAGDAVLQVTAERMLATVRAEDQVFRLGGDEFVVLLAPVQNEANCVRVAERLIAEISRPIDVDDVQASIGASIGVAFAHDPTIDAERLLIDADAAVYQAKESGRGRVGIFDDALRETLADRAELEGAIRAGLDGGEFVLYYQPIVDLDTGHTRAVEALIRWQRPGFGLVPPVAFIPTAEASGLINDIGRWVLDEATAQLARWDAARAVPRDLIVSVNISGRHLLSPYLVDDVRDTLKRNRVAPHRLQVEVTETVLIDDPVAVTNLANLRDLGVLVALDDFGTGYTSVGQLPLLPIDQVKIDRAFIGTTEPARRELLRLMVSAAHAFGLSVVVEGIERRDDLTLLRSMGVESGQGYYFAQPAPAAPSPLLPGADGRRPAGSSSPSRRTLPCAPSPVAAAGASHRS